MRREIRGLVRHSHPSGGTGDYFGIAAAPEAAALAAPVAMAGVTGVTADAGRAPTAAAGALVGPGICAAPVAGTLAAGATSAGRSSTLPADGRARSFEKN